MTINGYDIQQTADGDLYIAVDTDEDMNALLDEVRRDLPHYEAEITEMGISLEKRIIDPDAWSVYNYVTGSQLEGTPTKELVLASLGAPSGAVAATYDSDAAEWSYLRDDEAEQYRTSGEYVRTVYVVED